MDELDPKKDGIEGEEEFEDLDGPGDDELVDEEDDELVSGEDEEYS